MFLNKIIMCMFFLFYYITFISLYYTVKHYSLCTLTFIVVNNYEYIISIHFLCKKLQTLKQLKHNYRLFILLMELKIVIIGKHNRFNYKGNIAHISLIVLSHRLLTKTFKISIVKISLQYRNNS